MNHEKNYGIFLNLKKIILGNDGIWTHDLLFIRQALYIYKPMK